MSLKSSWIKAFSKTVIHCSARTAETAIRQAANAKCIFEVETVMHVYDLSLDIFGFSPYILLPLMLLVTVQQRPDQHDFGCRPRQWLLSHCFFLGGYKKRTSTIDICAYNATPDVVVIISIPPLAPWKDVFSF